MSFSLFNESGLLAFSDLHNNMRLLEKRTLIRVQVTNTLDNLSWYVFSTTVTSPLGAPIVFVKPTGSGYITTYINSISGNDYTFHTVTSDTQAPSSTATMTAYVFVPDMISAQGYGVNVYKADGSIAFSTTSRLLKTSGYYLPQRETTFSTSPAAVYSLSSGVVPANYAICSQSQGFSFLPVGGTGSFVLLHGGRINGSSDFERGSAQAVVGLLANPAAPVGRFLNGQLYVPIIDASLYD